MQKLNNYLTKTAAAVAASFEKEAAAAAAKAAAAKAAKTNTEEAAEAAAEAEAKATKVFEKAEAAAEAAKEEKAEAAAMIAAAEAEKERIRKEAEEAAATKAAAEAKAEAAAEAKAKEEAAEVLTAFEEVLTALQVAKAVNNSKTHYISEGLRYALQLYKSCKFKTPLVKLLKEVKYAGKVKAYLDSIGIVILHNAKTDYMKVLTDESGSFAAGEYDSFAVFTDSLPKEKKKIDYQKRLKNLFSGMQKADIRAAINEYLKTI